MLKENLGNAKKGGSPEGKRYSRDPYEYTNREAAERIRRNMQERRGQRSEYGKTPKRGYRPVKVRIKAPGEITGKLLKWTGYSFGVMFGISLGIVGIVSLATGFMLKLPLGILALLFGMSLYIGYSGSRRTALAQRFRRYREVLGDRTYCLVEELASAVGQDCKFVQKDLKKMFRKGFFKEGYLDRKGTLLITDRETYQQYLTAQTEYEKRVHDSEGKKQSAASEPISSEAVNNLTPECRELIAEGKRYIQYVHECNDRIPGETMSAKLDRLELVITKIFHEAERNPDVVSELKKMMSYYLPTTKKLLDTYCELEQQPISGQNIESTRTEIENALDTLNIAFENLLDSLFEETAWDISSDISVLNTMLAQEGLTGKDFHS